MRSFIVPCGIVLLSPIAFSITNADDAPSQAAHAKNPAVYTLSERGHWSFQEPKRPEIPNLTDSRDRGWTDSPIDRFVLAKLKASSLRPAPSADRRTLIRRLSFDIVGLPPNPEAVEMFLADRSPTAYARLVDRLLADPRYGERWGQHWLDVVRFAESEGFEYDRHRPAAWRFRDYVIRSFNNDKPYTRFITEQLAGDEMTFPGGSSIMSQAERDARIATGFHRLGPVRRNAGNADVAFSRNEILTEMTDAVGSTFLALTVGCARCHDHMFDPFRQKDYYRLQAFLAATHDDDIPLVKPSRWAIWKKQTAAINAQIAAIKNKIAKSNGEAAQRLRMQLKHAQERLPPLPPSIFAVRNNTSKRTPIHLLKRGDEFQRLEKLGMRLPGVFLPDGADELPQTTPKPKTRLANWIIDRNNPLTARVMVNRIWQYHFGAGLVETSNDFGLNGARPSHPQLLDWLAIEFINSGWSVKSVHRRILMSRTYCQASYRLSPSLERQKDPRNRLLWRFARRRLDAEQIRDAMLSTSGLMNHKAAGESVMVPVDPELVSLLYKPSQWQVSKDAREHNRRSIYLLAKRNLRLPFLEVFDQPSLQTSCFRRVTSTHAPQSLELLNGKFSNRLSRAFAARLRQEAGEDPERQIDLGFRLALSRPPSSQERSLSIQFLQTYPLREFTLALFNLNSFLYVD